MSYEAILLGLAATLAAAGPLLFAAIGETISERAGVINLSMNGLILLSAMGSFSIALATQSLLFGFITGAVIGMLISLIVAFASITLKQSQVAVGFVLAMLCRDLAIFLGNPIMGQAGPRLNHMPIPGLETIPIIGTIFFRQDIMTYLSVLLIIVSWLYFYRTRPGLTLRGIGEKPAAAYIRGAPVTRLRYSYCLLGGAISGLAGPMFSLSIKAGWKGTISGLDGIGWIALAITIFGAWNPIRVALGAGLFAMLQWLGLVLQNQLPGIPSQVLQVAPFPLMIMALLLVNIGSADWIKSIQVRLPDKQRKILIKVIRTLSTKAPASLGTSFEKD